MVSIIITPNVINYNHTQCYQLQSHPMLSIIITPKAINFFVCLFFFCCLKRTHACLKQTNGYLKRTHACLKQTNVCLKKWKKEFQTFQACISGGCKFHSFFRLCCLFFFNKFFFFASQTKFVRVESVSFSRHFTTIADYWKNTFLRFHLVCFFFSPTACKNSVWQQISLIRCRFNLMFDNCDFFCWVCLCKKIGF